MCIYEFVGSFQSLSAFRCTQTLFCAAFGLKKEMLREHLLVATRHANKHELKKALHDYMASGLPTDCPEVENAARKLDVLSTKDGTVSSA